MNVTYLIQNAVLILAFTAAAVVALTVRNRHPRSAVLAAGGFAAFVVGVVISTLYSFAPMGDSRLIDFMYQAITVGYVICTLVGTALLVLAVVKKETTAPH